jgi:GNAT superfamily N-acetyltransferase
MMFNKILFPVDFYERCSRTATYVASVVRKFQGELTLLHAFDLHDAFGYGAASSTVIDLPFKYTTAELGKLGVRRLSAGAGIPQVLWNHAARLARAFLDTGDSQPIVEDYMAHAKLQELFAGRLPNYLS